MIVVILVIVSLFFSALFLGRLIYLHTQTIEVVTVSIKVFSKLQSIYEFRQDLQNHVILNSPKTDGENVITGIMLVLRKTTSEIKLIKKFIKQFEVEISNELNKIEKESEVINKYIGND